MKTLKSGMMLKLAAVLTVVGTFIAATTTSMCVIILFEQPKVPQSIIKK